VRVLKSGEIDFNTRYERWDPDYSGIIVWKDRMAREYLVKGLKDDAFPGKGLMFSGEKRVCGVPVNPRSGRQDAIGIEQLVTGRYVEIIGQLRRSSDFPSLYLIGFDEILHVISQPDGDRMVRLTHAVSR
jgi:hypothetical protein